MNNANKAMTMSNTEVSFDSSWQKRGHILMQKFQVNDVSVGIRKTTKKYSRER